MAFNSKVRSAAKTMTPSLLAATTLLTLGSVTIGHATAQDAASPSPLSVADASTLITPTSIGEANTCLTLEEIQRNLSTMSATIADQEVGRLADTSDVLFFNAEGELAFHAPVYGDIQPDDKLRWFVTSNPEYQTAEGIGPGTLIAEAERLYGPASLSYHSEVESREFVTFENGPENISFRTGSLEEAGVYSPQEGPYFQTETYREGATIRSVWVNNRSCFEAF